MLWLGAFANNEGGNEALDKVKGSYIEHEAQSSGKESRKSEYIKMHSRHTNSAVSRNTGTQAAMKSDIGQGSKEKSDRKPHSRERGWYVRDRYWTLSLAISIGDLTHKIVLIARWVLSAHPMAPTIVVWTTSTVVGLCLDIDSRCWG